MPRGSDFEARWTEGAWAEARILEALNVVPELISVQFGITEGTAYWSSRATPATYFFLMIGVLGLNEVIHSITKSVAQ
jgi:hypothetical protein